MAALGASLWICCEFLLLLAMWVIPDLSGDHGTNEHLPKLSQHRWQRGMYISACSRARSITPRDMHAMLSSFPRPCHVLICPFLALVSRRWNRGVCSSSCHLLQLLVPKSCDEGHQSLSARERLDARGSKCARSGPGEYEWREHDSWLMLHEVCHVVNRHINAWGITANTRFVQKVFHYHPMQS